MFQTLPPILPFHASYDTIMSMNDREQRGGTRLWDPGVHQLLERLRVGTQRSFQGRWSGDRRSRSRGVGLEFADYRPYQLGDDFRYVDWNLYARLGRLYLKIFSQEQNLPITFLLDVSGSMKIGEPSKLDYARDLVTLLGYVALSHSDTVQLVGIADRIRYWSPVLHGKSQLPALENYLSQLSPEGHTDFERCVSHYLRRTVQTGVVIVVSDVFTRIPCDSALRKLSAGGHEPHLIHVLAHEEVAPPVRGEFRLTDVETGSTRDVSFNETTLTAYNVRLEAFYQELRDLCLVNGITYTRCVTDQPMEEAILALRRNGVLQG